MPPQPLPISSRWCSLDSRACAAAGRTCGGWRRRGSRRAWGNTARRVRHRLVEEQLEEVVADVVVGGDVVAVALRACRGQRRLRTDRRSVADDAVAADCGGVDRRPCCGSSTRTTSTGIVARPPALDEPTAEPDRSLGRRRPCRRAHRGRSRRRAIAPGSPVRRSRRRAPRHRLDDGQLVVVCPTQQRREERPRGAAGLRARWRGRSLPARRVRVREQAIAARRRCDAPETDSSTELIALPPSDQRARRCGRDLEPVVPERASTGVARTAHDATAGRPDGGCRRIRGGSGSRRAARPGRGRAGSAGRRIEAEVGRSSTMAPVLSDRSRRCRRRVHPASSLPS